jgi:excisionase family DNA binding protein
VDVSVADAAALLGVGRSRVQRMLRDGALPGRRLGREWLVDGAAVAQLADNPHRGGRPMAPARVWGLLDLLDGGTAPWLSPVARSQVRQQLRLLAGGDAGRWRDVLRRRSTRIPVRVHPAALSRIGVEYELPVLWAGPARAAAAGADLVVLDAMAEVYAKEGDWPRLAKMWHARPAAADANLLVRLPVGVWPFHGRSEVGSAVLAADLLESAEPRAVAAGLGLLDTLTARREAR